MKRGRKSTDEKATARLLDFWEPGPDFGEPIGCLATTYTFDAGFFEEECLARFAGIQSDSAEDGSVYLIEREEKLSQCFACVLVDQTHVAANRSLRWNLLPVRLAGGIQHAKLSILAWQRHIRVLIGSANLTTPAYRRNYETVACLDFGPDDGIPSSVLHGALAFADQVRGFAPGADAKQGVQANLRGFLKAVRTLGDSWPERSWPRSGPRAELVPIHPESRSMFEQVGAQMRGAPYDSVWVQSPFFNDGTGSHGVVDALEKILGQRGERTINFVGPGHALPDGRVELEIPLALESPRHKRMRHQFHYVDELPEQSGDDDLSTERRPLHAKSLWFERDDAFLYVIGSSNFTAAGMGLSRRSEGNLELNVLYTIPDSGSEFATICKETSAPYVSVDLDDDEVSFLASVPDRTTDGGENVALPEAFGAATYDPSSGVILEIGADAPPRFRVLGTDDHLLLDETNWRANGCSEQSIVAWPFDRPPSHVVVTWPHAEGTLLRGVWPVNVLDSSMLPPPEELRTLTLEELVEILTSAQPTHEAMRRILRRRTRDKIKGAGPELDPHKRVDTSSFLLKRMARVGRALEGLRERLQRPLGSLDALRWRLEGPIGPLAVARRLAAEERDGGSFMIAEVAQTVADIRPPLSGAVTRATVQHQIGKVLHELQTLAEAQASPPSLARYVEARFAEMGR